MNLRQIKLASITFLSLFVLISCSNAQDMQDEPHIEVALRMIGHQVLLSFHDSTSRVLPIVRENDQYKIQFESEFTFNPEELVFTINNAVKETGIAKSYIVEVEKCETGEVVYSFEMNHLEQSDIIPCKTRDQPQSCYNLVFTLMGTGMINEAVQTIHLDPADGANAVNRNKYYSVFGILLLMIVAGFFFLRTRRNKFKNDPNLIQLGTCYFDKLNNDLIIDNQKIELSGKEADLLLLLYNAVNTTVKRETILNKIWEDDGDYVGRTMDVFISKLRKKLGSDSSVKIVNIRGVGYKLVLDDKI